MDSDTAGDSDVDTSPPDSADTQADTGQYSANIWPAGRTADWSFRTYDDLHITSIGRTISVCHDLTGTGEADIVTAGTSSKGLEQTYVFGPAKGEHSDTDAVAVLAPASYDAYSFNNQGCTGDLNGDGGDELLFYGSPTDEEQGVVEIVEVFFSPFAGQRLQGTGDIQVRSGEDWSWYWRGAAAFDLDGTGVPDLVTWSSGDDPEGLGADGGVWYVFPDPDPGTLELSDASASVRSQPVSPYLVRPLAGDLDGDGHLDLVLNLDLGLGDELEDVGVLLGPISGSHDISEADITIQTTGDPLWDGLDVESVDVDVDGDGMDDLVARHGWTTFDPMEGHVQLMFFTHLRPGAMEAEDAAGTMFQSVGVQASVADIDGDGMADLASGGDVGRAGCVFVQWSPLLAAPSPFVHEICADEDDMSYLGEVVDAHGDIDGDGYRDFLASSGDVGNIMLGWSGALLSEFLR